MQRKYTEKIHFNYLIHPQKWSGIVLTYTIQLILPAIKKKDTCHYSLLYAPNVTVWKTNATI